MKGSVLLYMVIPQVSRVCLRQSRAPSLHGVDTSTTLGVLPNDSVVRFRRIHFLLSNISAHYHIDLTPARCRINISVVMVLVTRRAAGPWMVVRIENKLDQAVDSSTAFNELVLRPVFLG
jgi:hypothetical protein